MSGGVKEVSGLSEIKKMEDEYIHIHLWKNWDLWDCIAKVLSKMNDGKKIHIPNGTTEKIIIEKILEVLENVK